MLAALRKPEWLNKKIELKKCEEMFFYLKDLHLNTICQEARCPNISECFSKGVATFLILGDTCTRNCRFCAVKKGRPSQELDEQEPHRIAQAVERLGLKHIVITSVTRDDLPDGGAAIFVKVILNIRKRCEDVRIELLIPDFEGNEESVRKIVDAKPDIIAHNLETVPRLYKEIRNGANYTRSLKVLEMAKGFCKDIYTKSGIMLGFGEEEREVLDVFYDLRKVRCDFLSIGQYLAPSREHFPVKEYVNPDRFLYYKKRALELGFLYVESGPYVRSSYLASEYLGV